MLKNQCPHCGTFGKIWHKQPEAFICPHCFSVFSEFGIILETENEQDIEDLLSLWN